MSSHTHHAHGPGSSSGKGPEIDVPITLQQPRDDGSTIPLDSRFRYASRDPYAVDVLFLQTPPNPLVRWVFARDLLLNGMYEPTQDPGDVAVWPMLTSLGEAAVMLSFQTDQREEGFALLAKTREIQEFLNATLRLVPAGDEALYFNLDNELNTFLTQQQPHRPAPPKQL